MHNLLGMLALTGLRIWCAVLFPFGHHQCDHLAPLGVCVLILLGWMKTNLTRCSAAKVRVC